MSVTIKDIASLAGVSYSTVSKALNDSPLVKEKTKRKIFRIADQLGYVPNFAAKSLVSKKSNTIGLLWPTVERTAVSTLATHINNELEKHSYSMILSINEMDSAIQLFNRLKVDGILVFEENHANHVAIRPTSIPIICYGESGNSEIPYIDVDRKNAIFMAVKYLYSLGHRRIAYIGDSGKRIQKEKYIGFTEGVMKHGLQSHPDMVINTEGLGWQNGYIATKKLLASSFLPTAIVCASYELTIGALRAIKEARLSVPKDISLISYDNIPQMADLEVAMTTVGAPIEKIAKSIVRYLLEQIDKTNDGATSIPPLGSELVIRESCYPPRDSE
jgi:LacI family transcriptional regulator